MRIILVNPPVTGEERYGEFSEVGGYSPPLGLCYIGAVLEAEGHSVELIDAEADQLQLDELAGKIARIKPDLVCITSMTMGVYRAFALTKKIKETDGSIKTVIGGAHVSAVPEETMRSCPQLDFGVIGEGEETIKHLTRALEKGTSLDEVDGIVYRRDGKIVRTRRREIIKDINSIPLPARHLLKDLKRYNPTPMTYRKFPVTTMITSRGCPYNCNFCDKSIFGQSLRLRSIDSVIEEIKHLKERYGIREIAFEDDTFTVNKQRTIELCRRIEELDIVFTIGSRVNVLEREVLAALKKAGCWQIAMGIESGNQGILNIIGKGINLEQVRKAVAETERAGIESKGFFMIGHPGETQETINDTINFAVSLPLSVAMFTIVTPLPGSKLYTQAKQYGSFEEQDWSRYSCWDLIFVPKGLTKEILKKYHHLAYKRFYYRPGLVLRHLSHIRSMHDIRRYMLAAKVLMKL